MHSYENTYKIGTQVYKIHFVYFFMKGNIFDH